MDCYSVAVEFSTLLFDSCTLGNMIVIMYNVGLNFQLNFLPIFQVAGIWMVEAPAYGTHSVMPKEGCLKTILEM